MVDRVGCNIYLSKMALTPVRALRFDTVSLSGAIFSVVISKFIHAQATLASRCALAVFYPLQLNEIHQIVQGKNFAGVDADVSF